MGVCRSAAVEHVDVEGALLPVYSKPLSGCRSVYDVSAQPDRLGPLCLP